MGFELGGTTNRFKSRAAGRAKASGTGGLKPSVECGCAPTGSDQSNVGRTADISQR